MKEQIDIRKHLVPLELLDINKCTTVGNTVAQMANCAMAAGMVGEAADTIVKWVEAGKTPQIILDNPGKGHERVPLNHLFAEMAKLGIARPTITNSHNYARSGSRDPIIVVGFFLNEWEDELFLRGGDNSLFINNFNLAPPWVKDGCFKSFVNADHRLALPILKLAAEEKISGKPISHSVLLDTWMRCGGVGHQAAHGFATFRQMVEDPDCTVFATMSGVLTMAKLGGLVAYMIDQGWVQAISATGALICHGLVESVGLKHFKHNPAFSDAQLAENKYNRIGTTLEPETNLDHVEEIFRLVLRNEIKGEGPVSPSQINYLIGKYLAKHFPNEVSILRSAFEKNIPVFIPARDSELDNDQLIHNWKQRLSKQSEVVVNNEIDALRLVDMVVNSKKQGIFTLGGGVPRNWIQNVMPLIEIMNVRLNLGFPERRFSYGCRTCPDPVYLEHLSGCTFDEMKSWRKAALDGRFSEVKADYSINYPFYVAGLKEFHESRQRSFSGGGWFTDHPRFFIGF